HVVPRGQRVADHLRLQSGFLLQDAGRKLDNLPQSVARDDHDAAFVGEDKVVAADADTLDLDRLVDRAEGEIVAAAARRYMRRPYRITDGPDLLDVTAAAPHDCAAHAAPLRDAGCEPAP